MADPEAPNQPPAEEAGAAAPGARQARPAAAREPAVPPGKREPAKPSTLALQAALASAWEGIAYEQAINFGDLEVALAPGDLVEACRRAKTHPALAFDYLMLVSGTDFETYLEVVYHLYSYRHHHGLTIKTRPQDYERPAVPSVTSVWPGANWHERETAEMLGIDFPGHPDLRPLLLEEGVTERPLRKSHPLVEPYADRPGIVTGPGA